MSQPSPAQDTAEHIPFEEFRNGLPHGRFHVIVNPALAMALIGPGIAAALLGYLWTGGLLVAAGILLRRVVKSQAPRILLHLATRMPTVYGQATEHGVMEVRRA